jgi:thiol-disulfide isomerase/thioredoxin
MRPLDVVRGSLDNWSDAELGALSVGMHKAREACSQAKPEDYSGDDLYDFVRLCALGQDWNATLAAALAYIASDQETHRAQAYALSITARVHTNDLGMAVIAAGEMLRSLPYDAEVFYAMRYLVTYLEQSADPSALQLAQEEHPALAAALAAGVPLRAIHGDATVSLATLYQAGMELAFLERYAGDESGALMTQAELEAALAKVPALSIEDRHLVSAVKLQYGLLGQQLPALEIQKSLLPAAPRSKPVDFRAGAGFGSATVLVLFPDWCAQCRKKMKTVAAFASAHAPSRVHVYGLMFHDGPTAESPAQGEGKADFDAETKDLQGTPTLLAGPDTGQRFGATDFPFAVITDNTGKIQFLGVIPGNAFDLHGYMDVAIARVPSVPAVPAVPPDPRDPRDPREKAPHEKTPPAANPSPAAP